MKFLQSTLANLQNYKLKRIWESRCSLTSYHTKPLSLFIKSKPKPSKINMMLFLFKTTLILSSSLLIKSTKTRSFDLNSFLSKCLSSDSRDLKNSQSHIWRIIPTWSKRIWIFISKITDTYQHMRRKKRETRSIKKFFKGLLTQTRTLIKQLLLFMKTIPNISLSKS